MPTQDASGRWISDDGLQYWDGAAWRPLGAQAAARKSWAVPALLIGCGFALVVLLVVVIGSVMLLGNAGFQRSFCNSWANTNANQACPFTPASP